MFQKKPIYIVGLIVFSLILLGNLAVYFLVPQTAVSGRGQQFEAGAFSSQMPEGFNREDFSDQLPEDFSGQLPEDFSGQLPGDFSGQLPEDFDFEGFSGNMPASGESGADARQPAEGQPQTGYTGLLQKLGQNKLLKQIRAWFWPILVLCVLADALCGFMLVHISRKQAQEEPEDTPEQESVSSRNHTNTWLALIALALVVGLVISNLPSENTLAQRQTQMEVLQQQAELGQIVSQFSGSGTLATGTQELVTVPATVKLTAYTVKNGDLVQAGDVLALVDKISAQKALYQVQTLISEMDQELLEVSDSTLADAITAPAGGRVKAIYASQGSSVADVMYENDALLLISLGGSMTVEISSNKPLVVGQSLVVTLSDGTQIPGKVQQNQQGKITVTTTDDGPANGDAVTVSLVDGTLLGSGELVVSSPLRVSAYWGTVKRIRVAVNETVESGDTLLTLEDTQDLARYTQLLSQREELTRMMEELTQMYQDGCIRADRSGMVSGLDEAVTFTRLSSGSTGSNLAAPLSWSSRGLALSLVADRLQLIQSQSAASQTTPPDTTTPEDTGPGGDMPAVPPEEPGEQSQPTGSFAGTVTKVSYGALHIRISQQDVTGMDLGALESMDDTLFTLQQQYAPELDVPVSQYLQGQSIPGSVSDLQAGDKVLLCLQAGKVVQIDYVASVSGPTQGGPPSGGGIGGGGQMPSFGGSGSQQNTSETEEQATYQVEQATVCTITPADTMTVSVSVDELDILSLSAGQQATISLDALPGQSFSATVSHIDPVGTNEGGSTKYTVMLELPREAQMLAGMNAVVTIEVGKLTDVLTVPAAAVYEDGTRTYVYTALDAQTGAPAGAVEVVTGASDGSVIQILSGLTSGDSVYYEYADTITYGTTP